MEGAEPDLDHVEKAAVERVELGLGVGRDLVKPGRVLTVPRQAIEALEENEIGALLPDVLLQGEESGSVGERSGEAVIGAHIDDLPALLLGGLAAQRDLVLDRGRLLHVRRKPRVDDGTAGGICLVHVVASAW